MNIVLHSLAVGRAKQMGGRAINDVPEAFPFKQCPHLVSPIGIVVVDKWRNGWLDWHGKMKQMGSENVRERRGYILISALGGLVLILASMGQLSEFSLGVAKTQFQPQ